MSLIPLTDLRLRRVGFMRTLTPTDPMKVKCPSCQHIHTGYKSMIGTRAECSRCNHAFYWSDCYHTGQTFIIYDLETTGLDADHDDIIQIAAMRFSCGSLCPSETYASYARPRRRISAFIENYTGVCNHHVKDAPPPWQALCDFSSWVGDATLIAHNGLRFDRKFLAATCHRHALPTREVPSIDSIHLSKMLFGKARGTGHSLDHLIARLRISAQGIRRHDARGDVEILGHAVAGMWRKLLLDSAFNGVPRHHSVLPSLERLSSGSDL